MPQLYCGSLCESSNLLPIVCEGRGQIAVGLGLLLKGCSHLFCRADCICAGNETARWFFLIRNCNQCLCELCGVAGLLTVVTFPKFHLLRSSLVVVLDRPLGKICGFLSQKLSAKEARIDSDGVDTKRFDLGLQRLHPSLKAKFRRSVRGTEFKPDQARS